jgi:excisionase family DNA binding protein
MRQTDIFTLDELRSYLKLPKSTLYKMSERGKIPSFKAGRQIRFRKTAIDKWIADQEKSRNGKRKIKSAG